MCLQGITAMIAANVVILGLDQSALAVQQAVGELCSQLYATGFNQLHVRTTNIDSLPHFGERVLVFINADIASEYSISKARLDLQNPSYSINILNISDIKIDQNR